MSNIFQVPDKENNIQSHTLYMLAMIWGVVICLIGSLEFYFFPELWVWWLTRIVVTLLIVIFSIAIDRAGYTRLAGWAFIIMLWLSFTVPCYSTGGIMAPGILSQMSVLLTAGFLLGWRGGLVIGLLTVGVDLGFVYLEITGLLPQPSIVHNPLMRWISGIIAFGSVLALQYYALNNLRISLTSLQKRIAKGNEVSDSLKASVERYKSLITVSNAGVWEYHLDTDRVWYSSQYFAIIGLDRPDGNWNDAVDSAWIERLHPDDRERSTKLIDDFLTGGSMGLYENTFRMRHEDGHWVWVWSRARRLRDKNGNLANITLGTHIDITEQKEASEALRASEERYKSIIAVSNTGAWEYHLDTDRVWYSSQYFAMIGLDRPGGNWDESMVETWIERLHPDDRERSTKLFDDYLKGGSMGLYENVFRMRHENGSWVWISSRARRLRDKNGNLTHVALGTHTDISVEKEAAEAVRESEERYRSIITVSNTGAWEFHLNTGRIWYSSEYFAMIGIDRPKGNWDESVEQNWVQRLHPDDKDRSIKTFTEYLQGGSIGFYENFFRMQHQNGEWIWIWSRARRLRDEEGNLTDVALGTHIDITERKKAEEKIIESEQLLRRITSQVPGNTYMFEIEESGHTHIHFSTRGTESLDHNYDFDPQEEGADELKSLHDDDKPKFRNAMKEAYVNQRTMSFQYRLMINGHTRWRWLQAIPDRNKSGKVLWYGASSDITPLVDYIVSVEQILFDIAHVLRRPISSMLGMTSLMINHQHTQEEIMEILQKLYVISEEMDKFSRELNVVYSEKRQMEKFNIDVSSLIDKRGSLFA